jgi:hypothetical protein
VRKWHQTLARVAGQMALMLTRGGRATRGQVLHWAAMLDETARDMRRKAE